jgi:hypothetical protein
LAGLLNFGLFIFVEVELRPLQIKQHVVGLKLLYVEFSLMERGAEIFCRNRPPKKGIR